MKFELNSLPRNCSDEEIIAEIKRVDIIVGKNILTKKDYDKHGKITSSGIQKKLGDWQKVLIAAGLGRKYSGRIISKKMRTQKAKFLTNDEILNELKRIATLLNKKSITTEDVRDYSEIISKAIIRNRFGSWVAGMKKAGLKVSEMYRRRYSDEEYFENLLNVWAHYGKQPLWREINTTPSEISAGAYENRFGSWRKALEAFVVRMNQDKGEIEQISEEEKPEVEIRAEIKKHSVSVEDKRSVRLGLRYKVLSRDKFKCVKCGTSPATDPKCKLHIDHIIPFSKGGKTILNNLQTLCEKCNLGKGNRYFE